jgi:hypothetical protein
LLLLLLLLLLPTPAGACQQRLKLLIAVSIRDLLERGTRSDRVQQAPVSMLGL